MANQNGNRNKRGSQREDQEREGMSREEAGHLGGEATKEKYGPDFYEEIGRKGGEATAETHDSDFFQEIGHEGGEATKRKHGPDFYREI